MTLRKNKKDIPQSTGPKMVQSRLSSVFEFKKPKPQSRHKPQIYDQDRKTSKLMLTQQNDGDLPYTFDDQYYHASKNVFPWYHVLYPYHLDAWLQTKKRLQAIRDNPTLESITSLINFGKQTSNQSTTKTQHFPNLSNLKVVLNQQFLENVIPVMASECLRQDVMPIATLVQRGLNQVKISRKEVFYILCNMFFSILPYQIGIGYLTFAALMNNREYVDRYPKNQRPTEQTKQQKQKNAIKAKQWQTRNFMKIQKLKCLLNYFVNYLQLTESEQNQQITFRRVFRQQQSFERLEYQNNLLHQVEVTKDKIEDRSQEITVDFANKSLGGGVLGYGLVQEEIMFIIHPQLIASMVLFHELKPTEAAVFEGFLQYSDYEGYSYTFKYLQMSPKNYGNNIMIAIDALNFAECAEEKQYEWKQIWRQIKKCYVGYIESKITQKSGFGKSIATGRWGCGAFKGNPQLKFVIQWIVCSMAQVKMIYCDPQGEQIDSYSDFVWFMRSKKYTVYQTILKLKSYVRFIKKVKNVIGFFDFVVNFANEK